MRIPLPCLTLIYVSCHFQILLNIFFFFFYLFSKCARNIQKYCSNENSCVCFMGYSGYDCSQVEPTIQPPPIRRTASPPDNTPPSVDKSHSTPTNTYIRKSIISVPHQKISHTEKNGTCKMHVFISYLLFGGERFLSRYVRKRIQEVDGLLISIFRLSNCQERTYHFWWCLKKTGHPELYEIATIDTITKLFINHIYKIKVIRISEKLYS